MTSLSQLLADFFLGPLELDPSMQATVQLMAEGTVRAALAGREASQVTALRGVLEDENCSPQARPVGGDYLLDTASAAMLTGTAARVDRLSSLHDPTDAVVAAGLAVADWQASSGPQTLEAIACGLEVAMRLRQSSIAWKKHILDQAVVAGAIGAAASCARLLHLTSEQARNALGLAACQLGGLAAALGTDTIALHTGRGASIGVESSMLALRGFTGATASLGPGLVADSDPSFKEIHDGLGQCWLISQQSRPVAGADAISEACSALGRGFDARDLLDALCGRTD